MGTAAAIRIQVEATLSQRVPAALTLKIKQAPELFATGTVEVDAMLGGGIPCSSITEVSGTASTGKTSFAPGTASGFVFLSNEDETGISNAIIHPKLYEQNRATVTRKKFLLVEGVLQNQDGVINVRATTVRVVDVGNIAVESHDFH